MITNLKHILLIVLLAHFAAGCGAGSRVTMDEWRRGLEQYAIATSGGAGDLSFLREPGASHAADSPHHHFTMIGTNLPERSTDVTGVLLGRRTVDNEDWLVFLVAKVENRNIRDIRVAMLSDETGRRRWRVGDDDARALAAYKQFRDSQWQKRDPERSSPPIRPDTFPAEDDVFRLETSGNSVTVLEERSGVRWTLRPSGGQW